ncbi:hypothetical protein VTK73DRAFT_4573 [Phialemonium thermophilum]|uniref:Uncharacterized protein n=1 Tax=Phialemonium thermophilum TaxID=223376 RepID=A0ABR3V7J3_9PEZI
MQWILCRQRSPNVPALEGLGERREWFCKGCDVLPFMLHHGFVSAVPPLGFGPWTAAQYAQWKAWSPLCRRTRASNKRSRHKGLVGRSALFSLKAAGRSGGFGAGKKQRIRDATDHHCAGWGSCLAPPLGPIFVGTVREEGQPAMGCASFNKAYIASRLNRQLDSRCYRFSDVQHQNRQMKHFRVGQET